MLQKENRKTSVNIDKIVADFRKELSNEKDPKQKVRDILDFSNNYFDTIGERTMPFLHEAEKISEAINYTSGKILCKLNFHFISFVSNDNSKIDRDWASTHAMLNEIKNEPTEYTLALNLIAYNHWFRGEFEKAFDKIFEAVKNAGKTHDGRAEGWTFYALGVFYFDTKDLQNSGLNYEKSLRFFEKARYPYGIARAKTGIASVKIRQEKLEEATPLLEEAISFYRDKSFYAGLGRALNDLALIEKANKEYKKAIELLSESLQIRKEINHIQGLITTYTELGELYLVVNENELALENLQQGLKHSVSINAKYKSIRLHKLLSDTFKKIGDIHLAFEHFEKFHDQRSDVLGEESANNIRKLQTKFETEKSEKEAEIERLKNVELKKAHDEIEQKNKDITDSINYAKRIQYALLAHDDLLKTNLPEHFVLFKPKDIVSGDFYWATKKNEKFYLGVCDSTGHGVPGAFMSLLNISFLNEAISEKQISEPNKVLDHVRFRLIENISRDGQQDGMDGTLVCFEGNKITYAAAHNPPVLISKGQLTELDKDKMPVGKSEQKDNFRLHTLNLNHGDCLYLYTDGYADQFGGPNGKKFLCKKLNELLLSIHSLPLEQQKQKLDEAFVNWKGNLEQVDDVCIIGIRA
jgi:serine phosphatase RsbU (regulator of sigma subunit)